MNKLTFKQKGCYIVTASSGVDSIEVEYFQDLRDDFLAGSFFGRLLINTYYRISPTIAAQIAQHEILRKLAYYSTVYPLYMLFKNILGIPYKK